MLSILDHIIINCQLITVPRLFVTAHTFCAFSDDPKISVGFIKPATHLAILYADRCDRRKSPGVPGAVIAIFADRRDRRRISPISGMPDIRD